MRAGWIYRFHGIHHAVERDWNQSFVSKVKRPRFASAMHHNRFDWPLLTQILLSTSIYAIILWAIIKHYDTWNDFRSAIREPILLLESMKNLCRSTVSISKWVSHAFIIHANGIIVHTVICGFTFFTKLHLSPAIMTIKIPVHIHKCWMWILLRDLIGQ